MPWYYWIMLAVGEGLAVMTLIAYSPETVCFFFGHTGTTEFDHCCGRCFKNTHKRDFFES